jgi:hypothetical protein
MVSMNSGYYAFRHLFALNYIRKTLNQSVAVYSGYRSATDLPWIFKPVWGAIIDAVQPARYRFKAHITFAAFMHLTIAVILAINGGPTYDQMFWFMCGMSACVAYIDSLANGLTAMITQNRERIKLMKEIDVEEGEEDEGDESMKAFGIFTGIRAVFVAIMNFVGGMVADSIEFRYGIFILAGYPLIMFVFAAFFYKEEKVRRFLRLLAKILVLQL